MERIKQRYKLLHRQASLLDIYMQKIIKGECTIEDIRKVYSMLAAIKAEADVIMLELNFIEVEKQDEQQLERTKHCPTCKGKGWVHTYERPRIASDVCPDCKGRKNEALGMRTKRKPKRRNALMDGKGIKG